jgi:hypothetical protein
MHQSNSDLIRAFPSTLHRDVITVLSVFPEPLHLRQGNEIEFIVAGEIVSVPCRLYHDPARISTDRLNGLQKELVDCLLTRHCSGTVRQEHLARIICSRNVWVPPFVVQLLGEYVIEILNVIHENQALLDTSIYSGFLRANPAFLAKTEQRVASYWNCYYRSYKKKEDYVGFQLLDFFKSLVKDSRLAGV